MPTPNPGAPVITFNHNLANPDGVMDAYIAIAASTTDIKNKKILAENIQNYIQGPSGSRYAPGQIDENVKELTRIYQEKYKLSEEGKYKVKRPAPTDIAKYGLTVSNKKVGQSISDAINGFDPKTFYQLMEDDNAMNLDDTLAKSVITPQGGDASKAQNTADSDPVKEEQEKIVEKQEELKDLAEAAKKGSAFLKNISLPYYVNDDYNTELGIIGNIYLNVKMLYDLSIDANVESQDKKEKNEIALYDFIKNILAKVSPSIGNVNNFDLIVDNKSNAQIIDVNFVSKESPETIYKNAFELQLHNLNSVVRSYKLESKIFPEQSSIVAIGAQVEGGALGVDTSTFVAFNRSIRDRIIPVKTAPVSDIAPNNAKEKVDAIISNIETIYKFFGELTPDFISDADFDADQAGSYQNALRDLINDLKSLIASKTNNKAILPTVLSVEMDGIGGLIIGNLFKINTDILPKGYKGSGQGGVGPNVGYTITGLGHSVGSGDWVTKIDAQTIILDSPQAEISTFDYSNITINVRATTEKKIVVSKREGGAPLDPVRPSGANGALPDSALVNCGKYGYGEVRMVPEAAEAFKRMAADAQKEGIKVVVSDSYRTYAVQNRIFDWDLYVKTGGSRDDTTGNKKAKRKKIGTGGKTAAAFPGTSNHGWGIAMDVGGAAWKKFIRNNGVKYGWSWFEGRACKEDWHFTYAPKRTEIWPV